MNVQVNEDVLARACTVLQVPIPSIQFVRPLPLRGTRLHGTYCNGHITLYLGSQPATSRILEVAALNETLLHELRHHWQAHHAREAWANRDKPGGYFETWVERDAREWSEQNSTRYRCVRLVPRSSPSRGFAALSKRSTR